VPPKAQQEWFQRLDDRFWLRPDEVGQEEAAFIRNALHLRRGQCVLDAPCGAGRIAVHLANAGCIMTGVDLRESFIKRARARFRKERLSGRFLALDLRELDFFGEFHAIYNWFGSFGYFSDNENEDLIGRYARALRPGGRLLIDQPNREFILRHFRAEISNGAHVTRNRYDVGTQRVISTWSDQGKRGAAGISSMRLYTLGQEQRLLRRAGLEIECVYGSHDGSQFNRGSRRMILVARKERA